MKVQFNNLFVRSAVALFVLSLFCVRAYAAGSYVEDPDAAVQPNSYVGISTVYNGQRYYLGVDTVAAKTGTYQVKAYNEPSYATMWQVGGLWSPTGAVLPEPNKNYQRIYHSVYMAEKYPSAPSYLSFSGGSSTYSNITLVQEADAPFWYSEKDDKDQGRFIMGFLYYKGMIGDREAYRYLAYDALYGFGRAFATKPAASQRMTRWTRTVGTTMSCQFTPATYTFGLNLTNSDIPLPYTFRMRLEKGGDRFRSRFNNVEIYATQPEVISDQHELHDMGVKAKLDWASSKDEPAKKIYSIFETKEQYYDEGAGEMKERLKDSIIMKVDTAHVVPHYEFNNYTDTVWAIGHSPFSLLTPAGNLVHHRDYLHIHMTYDGKEYVDSALVTRRFYYNDPFTNLTTRFTPNDHTFPYFETADPSKDNVTFTISGTYQSGNRIRQAEDGYVVSTEVGEKLPLGITYRPCMRDTTWQPVVNGSGDTTGWSVKSIALYDTLLVNAYLADGVTPAIVGASGATAESWLQSVELTARNQIKVTAKPQPVGAADYRTAMIKYSYTYRHSLAKGDTARSEQVIWVIQEPFVSHELIAFSHQTGASGEPLAGPHTLQQVPEIRTDYYFIPEIANPLPIHHDHWGYNRWYIYSGANAEKDIEHNWHWETAPTNKNGGAYSQLNGTSDKYSRGRIEMNPRIADLYQPSNIPAVSKSGASVTTYTDTLGVDVSAYTDTVAVGSLENSSLSAFTEPTLSYRQLFAMRPATESADKMAQCRTALGANAKYMEVDTFLAPIGRQFVLKTKYAYRTDYMNGSEGNLQYVYYNNMSNDGSDPDMGKADELDLTKEVSYSRVGLTKTTGDENYYARLMTAAELLALQEDSSMKVIMVNARQETGYIFGKKAGEDTPDYHGINIADTATLRAYIEEFILNPSGEHTPQSNFVLSLTKTSSSEIKLTHVSSSTPFSQYRTGWFGSWKWEWTDEHDYGADQTMTVSSFTDCSDAKRIANSNPALVKLQMAGNTTFGLADLEGYLTATPYENVGSRWNPRYEYTESKIHVKSNNETEGSASNQAWLFYEIIEPVPPVDHKETAYWERKAPGGTWKRSGDEWTATELDGGGISTSYGGAEKSVVQYRLMTEHFQLAHFTVSMRDPAKEGPSLTALITEDEIDRDYDLLADLGLDQLGKPGTESVVTPYKRFAFNHTQFGYHYPVGVEDKHIPAEKRVFADAMPAKGEYCVVNKFQKEGHVTTEACAGATQGYMYCFNRAVKPLVFIDFTYPQPTCTDQDLVLMANFCNPTPGKNPRVKADYYGYKDGKWTKIYSFLTGNLTETGKWYQLALPLFSSVISQYTMFRCVGTVSGTGSDDNSDAYLLFDRFRLLAKRQLMSVFQKHTTCVRNDSITLVSRIDFQSSELDPGDVICYQFQKKVGDEYVPMLASDGTWSGPYTRRSAATTEVYPGYYKTGLTAKESVETSALKSTQLHSDYGMFVVPEKTYDPSTSNSSPSEVRRAALNKIAALMGQSAGARDSYLDETADIVPATLITLGDEFDFGDYNAPRDKVYVNEGTEADPYWVVYILARVPINASADGSFRIAMARVDDVDHTPNFITASCSYGQIVQAKGSVDMLVNENDAFVVESRETATANETLLPANQTYTVKLRYNAPGDKVGTAMFDLFRSDAWDRDYDSKTPEQQAAADAQFETFYGCSRYNFREAVRLFRGDNPDNPNRNATSWASVTRESFHWKVGITDERADSLYNILNRMVNNRTYEVGLSTRDLYLGSSQDAYIYLFPVGASGRYTVPAHDGKDSVAETSVCDHHIWLELHSKEATQKLRFGYDKMFGDTYMVPVIRASRTEANNALKVRLAEITHEPNFGIVIGWDSTYVVETNDPTWVPGTSSFRYTQDRILQESTYHRTATRRGYYYTGDTVTFRPVDAAHITELTKTDCECFNYDAHGTTYDPATPREMGDTEGTNVFIKPAAGTTNGCNKWHVLPNTSSDNPAARTPGHQVANNFSLRAGYWYKFRTTFFNTQELVRYDNGGDNPGTGYLSYFIVAVAPDTAKWTPAYTDGSNYWNDDENWTAIVDGKEVTDALARVPMGDTRVIINAPELENQLPVVNNDSLGDVTAGEVDWGFRTATCDEILFRPRSLIYGQELLDYRRAFVDVRFAEGQWRTFSPALKEIYSGDMYIPATVAKDADFAPLKFDDPANGAMSSTHNREWPYLFTQSFYNQTVDFAFLNTDVEGHPLTTEKHKSAVWQETNVLNMPLRPGSVNAIAAWGPEGNTKDMFVRLPKQESVYYYYTKSGGQVTPAVDLGRTAFAALNHNLAYDKTGKGSSEGITYTLTNETADQRFFFGNSSMALVDVYQLCLDNQDKLETYTTSSGGVGFNVVELVNGANYTNHKVEAQHQFYLSPMRGIGLTAKAAATSLDIILKPTAMVAMPGSMEPIPSGGTAKHMPTRANAPRSEQPAQECRLYVAASNTADDGTEAKAYFTLAQYATANDGYTAGEDVLSLTSPLAATGYNFHTPMAMYTICDNRPLMYDSRTQFTSVPLVFNLMSDSYTFEPYTMLSFATEGQWSRPFYLYDALTGDSTLIRNGMMIAVQTPASDQLRYYLNGYAAPAAGDEGQGGVATSVDVINTDGPAASGDMNAPYAVVYDMLGHRVAVLGETDMLSSLTLPKGVYLVQRGNRVERVIVK